MIRHLLKLVWHRKRANVLVMAEIFFSFLIVFAVVTLAVSLLARWRTPIGFSWQDVWVMDVQPVIRGEHSEIRTTPDSSPQLQTHAQRATAQTNRLMREIRSFPQVEAVAADAMPPYADRVWQSFLAPNGRRVQVTADQATDDFAKVMRLKILAGRWFTPDDEAQNYIPIVIDSDAAAAMFGKENPLGRRIADSNFGDSPEVHELRVVGVIAPFRQEGELSDNNNKMVFFRASTLHPWDPVASQIVIRVRPGTPASFEAELNRRLHPDSADVTFRVLTMESMRRSSMKMRIAPVVALTVIALFLISMVALGLTGVLWQTVTRRMREIGLRRAVGASGSEVRKQVLLEVVVLATLSIAAGVVIVVQLPLLGISRLVSPAEFSAGFAGAVVVIYAITLLCGAYPSWLASTIDPAEALRYE